MLEKKKKGKRKDKLSVCERKTQYDQKFIFQNLDIKNFNYFSFKFSELKARHPKEKEGTSQFPLSRYRQRTLK